MDPEEPSVEPQPEPFSLARSLHALRTAVFGEPNDPAEDYLRMRRALIEVSERLERIEDRFQSYRIEMTNLTERVEDALEQATKRHAKARAAESRHKRDDQGDGQADPMSDPEAYRAALARGGIGGV